MVFLLSTVVSLTPVTGNNNGSTGLAGACKRKYNVLVNAPMKVEGIIIVSLLPVCPEICVSNFFLV